jgi:hypothetical protein
MMALRSIMARIMLGPCRVTINRHRVALGPNPHSSRGLGLSPVKHRGPLMKLFEIEIGRKYKCDRLGNQYFGIVKEKRDGRIGVVLGSRVGIDDLTDRPGLRELLWLGPEDIHPL